MSEKITMIPIEQLKEHPRNFFRTLDEEELGELAGSIESLGMQHPVVVIRDGVSFTIISGHQRTRAARILEWDEVPCIIREFRDASEAEEALIDANTRTRTLTHMEMAKAIRRKKQLIGNRQGKRSDLDTTPDNNSQELKGNTRDIVANEVGVSGSMVDKLDKLNELIRPLELMVEKGELNATAAYEFACLSPEAQQRAYDGIREYTKKVTVAEAKKIRAEMDDKVKTAQDAASRNAATIEDLTRQLTQSRNTVDELNRDLTMARQKPVGERSPEDVQRIKYLESELNDAKRIVRELNEEIVEKGNEVKERDAKIDRLIDERSNLSNQLDNAANDAERARLLEEIERRDLEITELRESSVFIGGSIQFAGYIAQIATYTELAKDCKRLSREGYEQYVVAIATGIAALTELLERVEELRPNDVERREFPRFKLLPDQTNLA